MQFLRQYDQEELEISWSRRELISECQCSSVQRRKLMGVEFGDWEDDILRLPEEGVTCLGINFLNWGC